MFPVYVNDGSYEIPDDDICYIIAKEGIFLKKRMGVMESISPVDKISILNSVSSFATMHIKKIPGSKFAQVVEFFRAVYEKYRAEAVVLLFYDEEKKTYIILPPEQKVTAASLDYDRKMTIDGLTMVGTIHSHARMSAFHSGTDDDDEKSFDGLHITVGDVDEDEFSLSASIVSNGHRFMVDPQDYVDRLELVKDIDELVKTTPPAIATRYVWKNGKMIKETVRATGRVTTYRKFDKRYIIRISDKLKRFDGRWMDFVEKGTYTRTYGHVGTAYGGYGLYDWGDWGPHFDPSLWNEKYRKDDKKTTAVVPVGKVMQKVADRPTEFPGKKIDMSDADDYNPCVDCVHRDIKIVWAIEKYTDEDDDDFDESEAQDHFEPVVVNDDIIICGTCGERFYPLKEGEFCPSCGSSQQESYATGMVTCPECLTEILRPDDDMCPYCRSPLDVQDAVLEEAAQRDRETVRIADPEQHYKPLGSTEQFGVVGRLKNIIRRKGRRCE